MSTLTPAANSSIADAKSTGKPNRLLSLDALRGFDMFWIVSGEEIFHGLANTVKTAHSLTQNTTDWRIAPTNDLNWWERMFVAISNQLHHTPWNGFTFYDMIFPLFIFIAGVSMPYSFSNQLNKAGANKILVKRSIFRSLSKRTIILLILGVVVNGGLQFNGYENTRFASVLGRIGLACFFAAIIYLNCSFKKQVIWFLVLLLGYWAMMMLVPVPGFGAGVLTEEGNLSAFIDRILLPGKLHNPTYDPEGLLSTMTAICSALLGVFTGQFLMWQPVKWNGFQKGLMLIAAGIGLLLLGLGWNLFFPINKNMWTSSFVLYAGGWSVLLLAIFYLVIDVAGYKKWCMPFVWIGMNSILIYLAAHGVINFQSTAEFIFGGIISKVAAPWQAVILWTCVMLVQLMLLNFLYRKKWFLKI